MTIEFWTATSGPAFDFLKESVTNWNKSHIECQVELKNDPKPYGYADPAKAALELEEAKQPSLVLAPEYMTSAMSAAIGQKKVLPIHEVLDKEQLDRIALLVKKTFGDQEGNVLALPLNPACGILYTNKELLEKAGMPADFVPETMEELEAACLKIMQKTLVENGYTCAWPAAYLVEIPAAQQDIPLAVPLNGFKGYGTYQISQEWFRNHLFDIRRQVKEGIFRYAGKNNDAKKPFLEKKVAFYMQGSSHATPLQKEAKEASFPMGYGPLPTLEKGQTKKFAFPLGGAAIWVMDNKQTKSALKSVQAFLSYLASNEFQGELHKACASVPVSANLPQALQDFYKEHPLHKAVALQTIEAPLGEHSYGIRMPNYGGQARPALFDLIEKVVDIVNTTPEQVDELLKEFDATYSIPENPAW